MAKIDKRTKEYKALQKAKLLEVEAEIVKPKRIGSQLAEIFKKTGVKSLVDALVEDCGCKDREEALNRFHEEALSQYNNSKMLNAIADAYDDIFGSKVSAKQRKSQCAPCHKRRIQKIRHFFMANKDK